MPAHLSARENRTGHRHDRDAGMARGHMLGDEALLQGDCPWRRAGYPPANGDRFLSAASSAAPSRSHAQHVDRCFGTRAQASQPRAPQRPGPLPKAQSAGTAQGLEQGGNEIGPVEIGRGTARRWSSVRRYRPRSRRAAPESLQAVAGRPGPLRQGSPICALQKRDAQQGSVQQSRFDGAVASPLERSAMGTRGCASPAPRLAAAASGAIASTREGPSSASSGQSGTYDLLLRLVRLRHDSLCACLRSAPPVDEAKALGHCRAMSTGACRPDRL